jgi:HD-like signal output (HDOD) protein
VVRLGLHECRNLIFAVGMRSLFRNVSREQKERCETLWQHSFLTACLCRRLNTSMGLGFQGEEFSCGLSHDLGRLLIALGAPEKFAAIDPLDFDEGPHILTREQEGLGIDHCFFGAWFANVNQLPSSLSCACQFHHTPEEALEHQSLVALVAAADDMANHVQREKCIEGYLLEGKVGWPFLVAMEDDEAKAEALEMIPKLMNDSVTEAEAVLGMKIRKEQPEAKAGF